MILLRDTGAHTCGDTEGGKRRLGWDRPLGAFMCAGSRSLAMVRANGCNILYCNNLYSEDKCRLIGCRSVRVPKNLLVGLLLLLTNLHRIYEQTFIKSKSGPM